MYFLSVSVRTLDSRFLSVPARKFGIGNGWGLDVKETCDFSHLRVYTLILAGVDLGGSVSPLVATLAVAYNIIHVHSYHV